MNMSIQEKTRQIKILEQGLIETDLLAIDVFEFIKKYYHNNPYHNYLHALQVASYAVKVAKNYEFSEIIQRSLLVWALCHDAWHNGKQDILDEFFALEVCQEVLKYIQNNYSDREVSYTICRQAIIGTVFKNRWKMENIYWNIISDCDIGSIGSDVYEFIYYTCMLAYEFWVDSKTFFEKSEKWYFLYLLWISKNIFLSPYVQKMYPNSLSVIKHFYKIPIELKLVMFEVVQNEDITLNEFKDRFKMA